MPRLPTLPRERHATSRPRSQILLPRAVEALLVFPFEATPYLLARGTSADAAQEHVQQESSNLLIARVEPV